MESRPKRIKFDKLKRSIKIIKWTECENIFFKKMDVKLD